MTELNMNAGHFVENYFDERPVIFEEALRNNFLSWDEISEAIYICESVTQWPRLNRGGFFDESKYIENCGESGQVRRRLDKSALYDELCNGTTLVFNRMELASYKVRLIYKAISRFVGEHAVANGCITFGKDGSFGKHWGTQYDLIKYIIDWISRNKMEVNDITMYNAMSDFNNQGNEADGQ
ncbi:cupin [Burkholderia cepacia]|uniref:Cupin 4 family protein n=1 Tax=Burkholderia cepacia GG4 TaxID=1009846 RepID=A0A9W3JW78_BURCE|nr:cupin [Burkholderia cepacia]AFQ46493.1 Cupin 4 family protein [Burkholderia cepacia GG4]